ncbi:MAG: MFS transporter [Actinomycetota bacterium]
MGDLTDVPEATESDDANGNSRRRKETDMQRRNWILLGVCMATFMILIDVTIVNVALPTVGRQLHANLTDLQWIIDAYAIVLAALTLTAGTVADRVGRRLVFRLGLATFTFASLLCGLAGSVSILEIARAAQGLGGAAMLATSLALIGQEFTGPERAGAFAAWGATAGAGVALGPLAGGLLTQTLTWRWIFFVNVPVGLVALGIALAKMNRTEARGSRRLDLGGLFCFSGALFLLAYSLLRGNAVGWSQPSIVGPLVGAAALVGLFVVVEARRNEPMIELSLFRKPAFTGVSLAMLALAAGMFANVFFLSLYLQAILGYSPLQAGLRLLFLTGLVFAVPLVARPLVSRVEPRVSLSAGLGLAAAGLLFMHSVDVTSSWHHLIPGLLLCGTGIGLANPTIASVAMSVVERERGGMASGVTNTIRMAGLAFGIATLGALFQARIADALGPHKALAPAVASTGLHVIAREPALAPLVRHAFLNGLGDVLLAGAVITSIGAVAAACLIRSTRSLHDTVAEPESVMGRHALELG